MKKIQLCTTLSILYLFFSLFKIFFRFLLTKAIIQLFPSLNAIHVYQTFVPLPCLVLTANKVEKLMRQFQLNSPNLRKFLFCWSCKCHSAYGRLYTDSLTLHVSSLLSDFLQSQYPSPGGVIPVPFTWASRRKKHLLWQRDAFRAPGRFEIILFNSFNSFKITTNPKSSLMH